VGGDVGVDQGAQRGSAVGAAVALEPVEVQRRQVDGDGAGVL
jgi:hypothetical protein